MILSIYKIAQFPGIVGCVDGSHIPIITPKENEFVYVNRKNFHSANVQAVCDANLVFQDSCVPALPYLFTSPHLPI